MGRKRRSVTPKRAPQLAALILVWLAAMSCRTTIVTIGPMLPVFLKHLGLGSFWGGTLTALPLAIIALVSIPSGRVADRLGYKSTLILALGFLSVGCFVPMLDPTEAGLFLDVSATGIGIGLAQPTLAKLARSLNPENPTLPTTLYANALVVGGFIASLTTAPLILPRMGYQWPRVFAFWGSIACLTALGWLWLARNTRGVPIHEVPAFTPQPRLVPRRGFYPIAVAFAAQGAVFYALVTWLPDYYVRQGWSLAHASFPLAIVSLGSIIGGLTSPWLLHWGHGFRKPFLVVSLVMAAAMTGVLTLPAWAYLWSPVIGATTAIIFTLGMAAPAELVPEHQVGRASGLLLAVGYVGAVVGPLGYGALMPLGKDAPFGYLIACSLAVGAAALGIPKILQYQSSHRDRGVSSVHP